MGLRVWFLDQFAIKRQNVYKLHKPIYQLDIIGIILFFISPLLALPVLIAGVYKGGYRSMFWISCVMALCAFITPPFADLYRHTLMYFQYTTYGAAPFLQSNGHDFALYTLSHFFAQNDIPFEYVRAIFVFITYEIAFFLFRSIVDECQISSQQRRERFLLFLLFFLSVPFIWVVNGLRMATACYIAVLAWYWIYKKNYLLGIATYGLSLCFHFGALMFAPVLLFTLLPVLRIPRWGFLIMLILLFGAGKILLQMIPSSVISMLDMEAQVSGYMEASEDRFDSVMSLNGWIAMYLERTPLWLILYWMIRGHLPLNGKNRTMLYMIYFVGFLVMPFTVLFQKYTLFVLPIALWLVVHQQKLESSVTRYHLRMLTGACILMTFAYMYGHREVLSATPFADLLSSPILLLANADTIEQFRHALVPEQL